MTWRSRRARWSYCHLTRFAPFGGGTTGPCAGQTVSTSPRSGFHTRLFAAARLAIPKRQLIPHAYSTLSPSSVDSSSPSVTAHRVHDREKALRPSARYIPPFLNAFAFFLQDFLGSTANLLNWNTVSSSIQRPDDLRHARHAAHPKPFYRHERIRRRLDASALARSVPNPPERHRHYPDLSHRPPNRRRARPPPRMRRTRPSP